MSEDLNLVVLTGTLATDPEVKTFESGAVVVRLLVTIRVDHPRRRVDVVPATVWDPANLEELAETRKGSRVWIAGAVQRRFWESPDGRRSRLEVVAEQVSVRDVEVPA